jgi:gliding motility-associated-like protein
MPPTPTTATAVTNYYYVSQATTGGCESPRALIAVNVNPSPTITATPNNPSTCTSSNGSILISGLTLNTSYSIQYTKDGGAPTTATLTSSSTGTITLSNLSSATYSNISATLGGCSSNTVGPFTITNPSAPGTPTASSNSPLCVGSPLNLQAFTTATGNISYQWTGPNGFNSTLQNPSIDNVQTSAAGKYYVLVKLNNCTSEKDSIDVVVSAYPKVNLGPDLIFPPASQHQMISTIQNGPVNQYLWTPSINLSCTNCPSPIATIQNNITYILKVSNNAGCSGSDTVNIKVVCDKSHVFIPDAFTPDGDGVNDILMVRASGGITVKSFRIFNKWGVLVFEKINFLPNNTGYGWNGKVKGISSPPDVFVYTAEIMCNGGTLFTYKGNVSILK